MAEQVLQPVFIAVNLRKSCGGVTRARLGSGRAASPKAAAASFDAEVVPDYRSDSIRENSTRTAGLRGLLPRRGAWEAQCLECNPEWGG